MVVMSLEAARSLPLLFLFLLKMSDSFRLYNPRVALCPHDNSIEGLVDFCYDVISLTYDVIDDDINDYSIRDEQRIVNSTCTTYKKRNSCYNRLLLHCQTDSRVSNDIQMIIDRLSIYSRTCLKDTQGGLQLIRCYRRFSKHMRTCSQAFDAYYPLYVLQHQSSACRVLNSAINCLLQIEQEITDTCRNPTWSGDFHLAYIRPLVHRSQNSSHHLRCPINSQLTEIHFPGASLSSCAASGLSLLAHYSLLAMFVVC